MISFNRKTLFKRNPWEFLLKKIIVRKIVYFIYLAVNVFEPILLVAHLGVKTFILTM
jgi:hypothetical protein